jgi:hypothetical protein
MSEYPPDNAAFTPAKVQLWIVSFYRKQGEKSSVRNGESRASVGKNPGTCPTGKGWESGEMNEFNLK